METVKAYSHDQLAAILDKLCSDACGDILRSKGIVQAADQANWYYFDLVAGDYEIRTGAPDYTGRLCVIGAHLDRDAIQTLFGL